MRVSSFKVSNYRSIASADIDLADLTCLVGPNNEGKSNLLRALSLGLSALVGRDTVRPVPYFNISRGLRESVIRYDPDSDRPVGADPRALTTITVRLELTDVECHDFQALVGHSLNGDLPAQVQFTTRGESRVQYKKQRVGSQLTQKAQLIGDFLRERLMFQYVPPIRTAKDAELVIEQLLEARLSALGNDPEYAAAQKVIDTKIVAALKAVEADLRDVLPRFLPSVSDVHVEAAERSGIRGTSLGLRSFVVDDGSPTELVAKGSGVQSLAALALLRHGEQTTNVRRRSILAIEEPEAHLHSGALHALKPLLSDIAKEQQLIFATHSGVLVPTALTATTVIVQSNNARTSNSMAEVRQALGVRLADNLQSARLVLLCEGESDAAFWSIALTAAQPSLGDAISAGVLGFESTIGATNLSYQLQNLARAACGAFVVFDSDSAGRAAINRALEEGRLTDSEYMLMLGRTRTEAELEDLLAPGWVRPKLKKQFGMSIVLRSADKTWSSRLKRALTAAGKANTHAVVERTKAELWRAYSANPEGALSKDGSEFVNAIARQLHCRIYGGDIA